MSDLARVLAFAFRRRGAQRLPGADLRLLLAFDLRWFAVEDAKRVVQRALERGLLREEGGELSPTFEIGSVDVPVNWRPGLDVLDEEGPVPEAAPKRASPLPQPAPEPEAAPAPARAPVPVAPRVALEALVEEERARRGLLLGPEVARLVVERRGGGDVAQRAAELESRLLRG